MHVSTNPPSAYASSPDEIRHLVPQGVAAESDPTSMDSTICRDAQSNPPTVFFGSRVRSMSATSSSAVMTAGNRSAAIPCTIPVGPGRRFSQHRARQIPHACRSQPQARRASDCGNAVVLGRCRVECDAMGQVGTRLDRPETDQIDQQLHGLHRVRRPVPPTLPYHRREIRMRKPAHFGERDVQAAPILLVRTRAANARRSSRRAVKVERSRIAE